MTVGELSRQYQADLEAHRRLRTEADGVFSMQDEIDEADRLRPVVADARGRARRATMIHLLAANIGCARGGRPDLVLGDPPVDADRHPRRI